MTTAWALNAVGLLSTTIGVLLLFLYLQQKAARFADSIEGTEPKRAYEAHARRVTIAVGLLAAWLVVQDLALFFL